MYILYKKGVLHMDKKNFKFISKTNIFLIGVIILSFIICHNNNKERQEKYMNFIQTNLSMIEIGEPLDNNFINFLEKHNYLLQIQVNHTNLDGTNTIINFDSDNIDLSKIQYLDNIKIILSKYNKFTKNNEEITNFNYVYKKYNQNYSL